MINEHFEFKDWQKCFDRLRKLNRTDVHLVLSTHWASQGYWIEDKGKAVDKSDDYVYDVKAAFELEKRVIERTKQTDNPGLIL